MHPLPAEMLHEIGTDHRNELRREMADRRLAGLAQAERTATAAADDTAEVADPGARRWFERVPALDRRFARGL
jgi:hypothetical protein